MTKIPNANKPQYTGIIKACPVSKGYDNVDNDP
jgi:hypothetical protein